MSGVNKATKEGRPDYEAILDQPKVDVPSRHMTRHSGALYMYIHPVHHVDGGARSQDPKVPRCP